MNRVSLHTLYLIIVAGNCGYIICGDPIITTATSVDEVTGNKTYMTTYPLMAKGLVRVNDADCISHRKWNGNIYSDGYPKMKVVVARHDSNKVVIRALLKKLVVEKLESGSREEEFRDYGWIWVPWRDDTVVTDYSRCFKSERQDKIRGGNRIALIVQEPAEYHITIPRDTDIEVNLSDGDITYETDKVIAPTKLSIKGSSVNRFGNSGMSLCEEGESWDYHWSNSADDPVTKLETQKGHVIVPR